MAGLSDDDEAVDAALAADGDPFKVIGEAVGIALTGIEEAVAARLAPLDGESALFRGLPERLCDLIRIRNRLGYRLPPLSLPHSSRTVPHHKREEPIRMCRYQRLHHSTYWSCWRVGRAAGW